MQAHVPFDKRLKRIVRRHDRMANGAVHRVNSVGLIVARPRVYNPRFPLKGLILLVVAGFLFKGFLFSYLGAGTYNSRVAQLQEGTIMEQAGAWVMQPDPATAFIAQAIEQILP